MIRSLAPIVLIALLAAAPAEGPLYSNDFSKTPVGKPAESDFLVLAGTFAVSTEKDEQFLEVAATPVDALGALFGPAPETPACTVSARIWADVTGKRFPEFGIGSNDTGGYKLWLMPRMKTIVIRKGDETLATAKYDRWEANSWTCFQLQVAKTDAVGWVVRGKIWPAKTVAPKEWSISFDEKVEPAPGRASVWGNPYSGKPIRFDDLRVSP